MERPIFGVKIMVRKGEEPTGNILLPNKRVF
jgi:hypothetical protein